MIGKVLFGVIAIYLLVAIPFYLYDQTVVAECYQVCEAEGYNIVARADYSFLESNEVVCYCLDSFTRGKKFIPLN